jgi:integrase
MSITPRPNTDGTTSYLVRVKRHGKRLPGETFKTLAEAEKRERELKSIPQFVGTTETIGSFSERWLDDYPFVKQGPTRGRRRSSKTEKLYRGHLRQLKQDLGELRLHELERPLARSFAVRDPRAAMVARNMYSDALDDGLVQVNPFAQLRLEQPKGRKEYGALSTTQFHDLAETAIAVHGSEYGPVMRGMILFACYVGPRLTEALHLEPRHVDERKVHFPICKFDKPRTVLLLPEAATALRGIPARLHSQYVFTSKLGKQLTVTNHYALWNPVRHTFWAKLSQAERDELVDLDWHSLRHSCGHHFYVTLGFSDEETAAQLGHSDAALVRNLYGHARQGVFERMEQRLWGVG